MIAAFRRLARAPLFTFGAVATLGLGLGAAAAIVQVADAVYLRALPFDRPEQLVRLFVTTPAHDDWLSLRAETFIALREKTPELFEGVVGQRLTERTMVGPDGAEPVDTLGVTDGWAKLLGIRPQLGRLFTADEVEAGEQSESVLIADGIWRARFGADPGIVGRKVVIDGEAKSVVGVLPPGFAYPYTADFWHPTRADRPSGSPWSFNAPARLRDGVSVEAANAALAALAPTIDAALPASQRGLIPLAVPLKQVLLDRGDRAISTAMVVVALLLALVAANLAALFHARWLAARRELAVRAALGGGRGALARALALEGALIGGAGMLLGLALARLAQPLLARQVPGRLADVGATVALTSRSLALAAALTVVWFALAALLPAWRVTRIDPFRFLRGDSGAGGGRDVRRTTRTLVALQVGLALALGAATLALALDLRARSTIDLGYDPDGVAIVSSSLTSATYAEPAARLRFAARAIEAIRALPGVANAAAVHLYPTGGGSFSAFLDLPETPAVPEDRLQVQNRMVSPEFRATVGLRLLEGRWLTAHDDATSAPVAVISESVARRLFPHGGAVGRRIRNQRDVNGASTEVVGVVADLYEFDRSNAAWYRPLAQQMQLPETALLTFVLRARPGAAPPSFRALRDAVAAIDPAVALSEYSSARQLLAETVRAQRDAAGASAFLALFGLALAALGLFVRIAEAIVRRRRELGVRLALGATHDGLVRQLVAEGARLALAGLLPGAFAALALQRLLARQLDAPALADDLRPLAVAAVATAAAALSAAWLAGHRATSVDPVQALKSDN